MEKLTLGIIVLTLIYSFIPPIQVPAEVQYVSSEASPFKPLSLPKLMEEDPPTPYKEVVDSSFTYIIHALKYREGLEHTPKPCPAGFTSVGYGHNLAAHGYKYAGKYLKDGKVTYREATALLYEDFMRASEDLRLELPHLTKPQLYALTSLVLNCGKGKVKYVRGESKRGLSASWKKLRKGLMPNFLSYCIYKHEGVYRTSSHLKQARLFEMALWTGEEVKFPTSSRNPNKRKLMSAADIADWYKVRVIRRDVDRSKKAGLY